MSAIQEERIQVTGDPEVEAARVIDAIPVAQGIQVQSDALGDVLGIWRDSEDRFDVFFRGSMLRGSITLAKRALARFFSIEAQRAAAIKTIQEAFDKAMGIAPVQASAASNAHSLKN